MKSSKLLLLDAFINFVLGVLLIPFPREVVLFLGIPLVDNPFYASILGAVFVGIAIALFMQSRRPETGFKGLGLGGAIAINMCGGLCLGGWLIAGNLSIPVKGRIFLWSIFALLIIISFTELLAFRRNYNGGP